MNSVLLAAALSGLVGGPGQVPGAVSAVCDANGRVTVECAGLADVAARRPMRPDTMFWIASNTKGVAAATLLTLVDEGRVALDDPAAKYIAGFPADMTVRHLLSHTSGLPFFPGMPIDAKSVQLLAQMAIRAKTDGKPGEKYGYSNWGIDCAMAIVEVVTGEPFEKVMKDRILDPLGMTDTTFFPNDEQVARLASYYDFEKLMLIDQLQYPYTLRGRYAEAGGGLFSTAGDMVRFFRMIAAKGVGPDGRRILSEKSIAEWSRKQTGAHIKNSYSFGMDVDEAKGILSHGGAAGTYGEANVKDGTARVLFIQFRGNWQAIDDLRAKWKGI